MNPYLSSTIDVGEKWPTHRDATPHPLSLTRQNTTYLAEGKDFFVFSRLILPAVVTGALRSECGSIASTLFASTSD
jgi:hypothetical protein